MRGYFGIGVEGLSKPRNAGSLFRSAHAFGASFIFTVGAGYARREGGQVDTSKAPANLPHYQFDDAASLSVPEGCTLVGIELLDEATELPSFRHPRCAAYVLGPERGSLSPALTALCEHVVQIPTKFCINLGVAGAIVMYDRLLNLGQFAARPLIPGGETEPVPEHEFGEPIWRKKAKRRARAAAQAANPKRRVQPS